MTTRFSLVFCLIGLSQILTFCAEEAPKAPPVQRVYIKTEAVQQADIALPIRTSGKLAAKSESKLSFKTGGIVGSLALDEGRTVQKGQELACLKLDEIDANVEQARLALEKAGRDLERAQLLFEDSVATAEQVQNARTAYDLSVAQFQAAQFNLEYSKIKAPASGRILKRLVEQGEMVGPGYPVFLFASGEEAKVVRVNLADKDVVKLSLGDSARLEFAAYPERTFRAVVTEIGSMADPYTGTFEVELQLEATSLMMASGFIAKANIYPAKKESFILIPLNALIEGNESYAFVYRYEGGRAVRTRITVRVVNDKYLLSTSGLPVGAQVITQGVSYVKPDVELVVE